MQLFKSISNRKMPLNGDVMMVIVPLLPESYKRIIHPIVGGYWYSMTLNSISAMCNKWRCLNVWRNSTCHKICQASPNSKMSCKDVGLCVLDLRHIDEMPIQQIIYGQIMRGVSFSLVNGNRILYF